MKFKLLLLKLPDWWIKATTIAITTLLMIILIYLIAANVVSNPLYTVNAVNAIYKEEQWLELNIAFAVAP